MPVLKNFIVNICLHRWYRCFEWF